MTDDDDDELDLDLDLARFNTGDTSDTEAAAMIDCWQAAADLYQQRARGMRDVDWQAEVQRVESTLLKISRGGV
jgi:hypothetical protein